MKLPVRERQQIYENKRMHPSDSYFLFLFASVVFFSFFGMNLVYTKYFSIEVLNANEKEFCKGNDI